jgi:hypothetical protein
MTLVSLRLAVIGFVLLPLCGQTETPIAAGLKRSPPEARRTVTRAADCSLRAFGHVCHQRVRRREHRASDTDAEPTIYDSIDDCSPFSSVDGSRQLEFDVASGRVTLSDDAGGLLAPAGGAPLKSVGTFAADETTQQVFVRVAGAIGRYTLVVPSDSEQCILAAGASDAANLERSWFGRPEEDPELPSDSDSSTGGPTA